MSQNEPKVLVVEDESGLAESLRQGLGAEGFDVEVAPDGLTGLALATRGGYGVIVLDLMLPGVNGDTICSQLRKIGDWTPVLMLTARHGETLEAGMLDTGADDFLGKPFSFVVLVARIRALLRRGERERAADRGAAPLTVGDLMLDPLRRTTKRGLAEIALTPTEFALLEYLMRHPAQIVSRKQILDAVWDMAYDGDPNIVDVYISALRRKIDAPFGTHSIATVRGLGYRLTDQGS